MGGDRSLADDQLLGDRAIGVALRDQRGHRTLALGQPTKLRLYRAARHDQRLGWDERRSALAQVLAKRCVVHGGSKLLDDCARCGKLALGLDWMLPGERQLTERGVGAPQQDTRTLLLAERAYALPVGVGSFQIIVHAMMRDDLVQLCQFNNDVEVEVAGGGDPPMPQSLERLQADYDANVGKGGRDGTGFAIEAEGQYIGQCAMFQFDDVAHTCTLLILSHLRLSIGMQNVRGSRKFASKNKLLGVRGQ